LGTANFTDAYLIDKAAGVARYDLKSERGTILKVSPDFRRREIVCTGIRFPVALAFNRHGDLFCTDQEGATWLPNGNPFDELLHIQAGRHYGFPPRHPKHLPGVIDEPSVFDYTPQHQSTCGLNFNESVDGGPIFGPAWWAGDALVCGYSRGKIWRTKLVKTAAGYVAQTQLIAALPTLAADACVSPAGDLVVCAHSGEPDWGSGPNGSGSLYKITYQRRDLPQPVLAWSSAPSEIRIGFDRPLDPAALKDLKKRIDIVQGPFASAGERFEIKRPGYAVVVSQLGAMRSDIPVQSVSFTPEARTLVLHTKSLESVMNYAITWRQFESEAKPRPEALPMFPDVELQTDLHGLSAEWRPNHRPEPTTSTNNGWEGWLPHVDLEVSRAFLNGTADHAALWSKLRQSGKLIVRGQLDLWQMLQPAIQPGSQLDYQRTVEEAAVIFRARGPLTLGIAGTDLASESAPDGFQQVVFKHKSQETWFPFELSLATGNVEPALTAAWSTSDDARWRAFPLRRFYVPWAKAKAETRSSTESIVPPELAGGNWLRGKHLFFGETAGCSKCHTIRGEGIAVGPDLSNLVHRDYASVLKDIRYPNAALNPDHLSYAIQLADGDELTAVLRTDNREQITVADASGQKTISKRQIKSIKPAALSLMPEGLDNIVSAEQLKDLMTFLLTAPLEPAPIEIPGSPQARPLREVAGLLRSKDSQTTNETLAKLRILLCAGPKDHGLNEHDYPLWQQRWAKLLGLAENVTVTTASGFPESDPMRLADVIVFYSNNPGWSAAKARALQEFQQRGGGLVYFHFAVDGHDAVPLLAQQIGLAWQGGRSKFRHGALDLKFDSAHAITRGFSQLELHDESYWNLVGDAKGIHVLASGVEEGEARPLIWTRENGRGRVFVSIPGHYTWTFDDPLFRLLLLRGICWAAHQPEDRLAELAVIGAQIDPGELPGAFAEKKD
jgi:putative heme-binding domain-containing protein